MTTATRPVMTAGELATHRVASYGRDYTESDDGYSDMAAEEGRGWHVIAGWGRDGWDLGDWPYVMIYVRNAGDNGSLLVPGRRLELMSICEGDRSTYAFDSAGDRAAAIDYLFLWYAAGRDWAPLTYEDRERLDAGELAVDEKFRGPYRQREVPVWPVGPDHDPDGYDRSGAFDGFQVVSDADPGL